MIAPLLMVAVGSTSPLTLDARGIQMSPEAFAALSQEHGTIRLEHVPLTAQEHVDLVLERFEVTSSRTRWVVGHEQRPLQRTTNVVLLRGSVDGEPDSSVFLALSPRGVTGLLNRGSVGSMLALAPRDGSTGLASSDLMWFEVSAASLPPLGVPVCGVVETTGPNRGDVISDPMVRRHMEVGLETDYELASLFPDHRGGNDLDAAADYVTALYGAIAFIYDRDVNLGITLSYVRLWDTPDDLFNEADPLVPFRDWWNENMGDVQRDLAQFLTGRVNLPYGGVAWVSVNCSNHGYSVAGYILGSFVSETDAAFGNWDVTVTAHELGHNNGTYHTHDYGIDECAWGAINRGSIMSYCHTTTGGGANIDMRFHSTTTMHMQAHLSKASCLDIDCNANGVDDADDIAFGGSADANSDGVPDECQDCNGNGFLDGDDIAGGASLDVDADGVPDECEADCNANGVPDDHDIASGTSSDAWGDGIPDECEADCNADGQSDYLEIQADMTLDINRNVVLDACEDCDGDGTPDLEQLGGGLSLWVVSDEYGGATAFHPLTGVATAFTAPDLLDLAGDVVASPDGRVFLSDPMAATIIEIAGATGGHLATLPIGVCPSALAVAPSGGLVVCDTCAGTTQVINVDTGDVVLTLDGGSTETPISVFIDGQGDLIGADQGGRVHRWSLDSGALLETIVDGSEAMVTPGRYGLTALDEHTMLMSATGDHGIHAYDMDGTHLGRWETGGLAEGYWQLLDPQKLATGPGGKVLVATNAGNTAVQSYHPDTGLFQRSFYVLAQLSQGTTSFAWMPPADIDCNANLRPDACDIADGLVEDANGNGVPDVCECIGDITGDGEVDVDDVLGLIAAWGTDGGDVDGDGHTGVNDLLLMLEAWGAC